MIFRFMRFDDMVHERKEICCQILINANFLGLYYDELSCLQHRDLSHLDPDEMLLYISGYGSKLEHKSDFTLQDRPKPHLIFHVNILFLDHTCQLYTGYSFLKWLTYT